MTILSQSQDLRAPQQTRKRVLVTGEQRRVPKARIGGQRANLTPSPTHTVVTTSVMSPSPYNTNVNEDNGEQPNLGPPPLPPHPIKPPPKVPPLGPNGRYRLTVMLGNTIDYSEAVSKRMRCIFKERSDPLGFEWKALATETKTFYYEEFKKFFEWDTAINHIMKMAWEKVTRSRYSEYLSRMRTPREKEPWIPEDVWTKWCEKWDTPQAQAKHGRARLNRRQGSNGPAKPTHTGGSVSSKTSAHRLEMRLGRPPTLTELFRDTHTKSRDGQNFIDDKSKRTEENLVLLREQLGVDENQLYMQAVGGKDKRKRIYGIGSLASQVPFGTDGSSSTTSHSQVPLESNGSSSTIDASVQSQLDDLKEFVEQQKKCMEEEKKIMEEALAKEREERKVLSYQLEQALAAIAAFTGHGTPSSDHFLP